MNVNFAETKAIADALPIGIYAKRRIACTVSEDNDTSFYSPIADTITISYPQVREALVRTPETEDREVAIRSMLYHEVSHAILTGWDRRVTPQFNIFEDERIETILNDFYLDVDFATQVYRINGIESNDDLGEPKDAMQAFYHLVRFHKGDADLLKKVEEIIRRYATLSKTVDYTPERYNWWDYNREIDELYEEVKRRMGDSSDENKEENDGESGDEDGNGDGNGKPSANGKKSTNGKKTPIYVGDILGDEKGENASAENENADGNEDGDGEDGDGEHHGNSLIKIFSENVKPAYDDDIYKKFDMIISNFNKKNNSGSAMHGYSGVFNPRLAGREDYRFFERKASVNGTNKFGTFHLNLFLDNSGSFCRNMGIVNAMLGALVRLEKTNRNFTFDVVHCGVGEEHITDKSKCGLTCNDGTSLDYDAIKLYKDLQKSNTYNYTIVLYDGSCYDYACKDAFKAFNYNNVTIISDPDNEKEIRKYAPSAKCIITDEYTENLLDNVTSTLARAFR